MYNNVFSCSSSPWVAFDDMWFHQHRLIWRTNGEIWHDTNHINLFGVEYLDPLIWEVWFILSFFYCSSLPPKVLLLLESVFQGLVEWTNLISLKWLSLLCSWGLIWLLCSLGMEMDWAVTVVILWGHTTMVCWCLCLCFGLCWAYARTFWPVKWWAGLDLGRRRASLGSAVLDSGTWLKLWSGW